MPLQSTCKRELGFLVGLMARAKTSKLRPILQDQLREVQSQLESRQLDVEAAQVEGEGMQRQLAEAAEALTAEQEARGTAAAEAAEELSSARCVRYLYGTWNGVRNDDLSHYSVISCPSAAAALDAFVHA